MRRQAIVWRPSQRNVARSVARLKCHRRFGTQSQFASTKARPNLPFLHVPTTSPVAVRYFTSTGRGWFKHEAKLVARYTITLWGLAISVLVIAFAVTEEMSEREFPTPHDWNFMTRKYLRDANKYKDPANGAINWARALELSRGVVIRLEDPKGDGKGITKLSDLVDPTLEVPGEFINCDISEKSEEWRRGYFEAIMLAAKAAEHVDGWVRDVTRNVVSPPEYVIGPSNPTPKPIAAGDPHAPREEDCELAYPAADNWYLKILATKGFTSRQKIEAILEYASFMEYKQRTHEAEALYNMALKESTGDLGPSKLPFDPKTFALKDGAGSPSYNLLGSLTAIANFKARSGNVSAALPIYLSILKARRSLSNERPHEDRRLKRIPLHQQVIKFFAPPDYPAPPPDGDLVPWRSPEERCQEASLHVYIGEILYSAKSRDDGLSWTRDGVDLAEEQLRSMKVDEKTKTAKQLCRECLGTGLGNWSTMVSRLAKAEKAKTEDASNKPGMFSFWGSTPQAEGRWAAEEAVVEERIRRTRELLEEVKPPSIGPATWFKA